jgi:putative transposase
MRWCSSTPLTVKIRDGQVANRAVYLALGVTVDGECDVLGLWAGHHGDGGGAKCPPDLP